MSLYNSALSLVQAGYEQCEPMHFYGPAIRTHYLVHFVVSGKGKLYSASGEHVIKAGEGFLICPGETTFYQADKNDPWEYYWVGFVGSQVKQLLKDRNLGSDNPVFSVEDVDVFVDLLKKLVAENDSTNLNREARTGYLYLLLSHVPLRQKKRLPNRYIDLAYEYIEKNYSYDITIERMAKTLSLNRSYLYRLFMEQVGQSPQEVLRNYRLNKADEMLSSGMYSVTETANSCGFADLSHFSSLFTKFFGRTPRQTKQQGIK